MVDSDERCYLGLHGILCEKKKHNRYKLAVHNRMCRFGSLKMIVGGLVNEENNLKILQVF